MENLQKIEDMLASSDEEMVNLAIILFHNNLPTDFYRKTWKDISHYSDTMLKFRITEARVNIYKKRIQWKENQPLLN